MRFVLGQDPENPAMTRSLPILLALTVALGGCKSRTPPKPAPPAEPAIVIKAGDLMKEYAGNALAADAKYKGKVLQVTGKFGSAQKAPLMGYAVQLLPEDAGDVNLSAVQCFLHESAEAEVAKVQSGQMITLEGTCDGQALGQVTLKKCTLVK
jgi:hypothetical protein